MRNEFKRLRIKQLDQMLRPFAEVQSATRPPSGWIRAVRTALGISSAEVARRLGTSRQLPLQLEKAEAEDRITMRSLRSMANALDCDLVYALVPRTETLAQLAESRVRSKAMQKVLAVEHTMALEDQAVGDIAEATESEMRRMAEKASR